MQFTRWPWLYRISGSTRRAVRLQISCAESSAIYHWSHLAVGALRDRQMLVYHLLIRDHAGWYYKRGNQTQTISHNVQGWMDAGSRGWRRPLASLSPASAPGKTFLQTQQSRSVKAPRLGNVRHSPPWGCPAPAASHSPAPAPIAPIPFSPQKKRGETSCSLMTPCAARLCALTAFPLASLYHRWSCRSPTVPGWRLPMICLS